MAKKEFKLDVDKAYDFKKPLHGTSPTTVREALKWIEDHAPESEDGEVEVPEVEYLLIYAVRRMVALHKDQKRHDAGKLAERRYAPRIDQVENKPRKLAGLVEDIHATQEKKPEAKPAPKPKKVHKPKKAKPTPDKGNPEVAEVL